MKKEIAEKWIAELRSGKYQQTSAALQDKYGFCCLGVACHVFIPSDQIQLDLDGRITGGMPYNQPGSPLWLSGINNDFERKTGEELADLNDGTTEYGSFSFDEIADLIQLVYIHKILN